jgi:hypothetical protein
MLPVAVTPTARTPAFTAASMSAIVSPTATTAAGLAVGASDPAYMVFYKDTSFADAYAVAAAFATSQSIPLNQIQSVPEPTTLALFGGVAVAAVVEWRRRSARRGCRA